jgi:hypothetical protein
MVLVVTMLLAAASGLLPTSSLQTVAGSGRGFPGDPGFAGDGGPATRARLARPAQVSADRRGGFYIADSSNQRIRYVTRTGQIQTVAGSGKQGDCGDNGMAWDLCLSLPHGVVALSGGGLAIADTFNHKLRVVDRHGRMHTAAGPEDGLQQPVSVQLARGGGLLVTDAGANKIFRFRHGRLSVAAGNGTKGFSGDGGPAAKAELSAPADAVAYRGGVAIADGSNCRIRFVDAAGRITTLAGSGDPGYCLGAAAAFHAPSPAPDDVARGFHPGGEVGARAAWIGVPGHLAAVGRNLYVVDLIDNAVRVLRGRRLTTVAGGRPRPGFTGEAGPARAGNLAWPSGLAAASPKRLLVTDPGNDRVRLLRIG